MEVVIIVITTNGNGDKGDCRPWLHILTSTTQYYLKQISFVFLSKEIVILQDFSLLLSPFFFPLHVSVSEDPVARGICLSA